MLINLILSIFDFILSFIFDFCAPIFTFLEPLEIIFAFGLELIAQGMKIVSFFFNPGDLYDLVDLWFSLFLIDHSMDVIFFVLRKIPFLNIK